MLRKSQIIFVSLVGCLRNRSKSQGQIDSKFGKIGVETDEKDKEFTFETTTALEANIGLN